MSQMEKEVKMEKLWVMTKLNKEDVQSMSDEEVDYLHWLYFEESIYDLM